MFRKILYGPPNWLVNKFTVEDRRMFGFWILILSVIGAIFFGRAVLYVTILAVIGLVPIFTTETPVENEKKKNKQMWRNR